tara:strand:- start:1027 stop:1326 length:300 start_codon:yes stop_codon:yes gene_type:complete
MQNVPNSRQVTDVIHCLSPTLNLAFLAANRIQTAPFRPLVRFTMRTTMNAAQVLVFLPAATPTMNAKKLKVRAFCVWTPSMWGNKAATKAARAQWIVET